MILFIRLTKALSSGTADFVHGTPGRDPSLIRISLPCSRSTITVPNQAPLAPSGIAKDTRREDLSEHAEVWNTLLVFQCFHPHETITMTRHSQINGFSMGKKLSLAFLGSSASARSTGRVPKRLQIVFFLSMGLRLKMELIKAFFTSSLLTRTLNRIFCLESK